MSTNPWIAFFPQNVSKNPAHFVGPTVAGAIVQGIETGIIINQSVKFWSNAPNEHVYVRLLVAFVSVAAFFQTAIAFHNTWEVIVLGFGDWMNVVNLRWPDRIQPTLNCVMAAPFQAFLIWRCWNAMQRKFLILIPLIVLLIASVIANVVITVQVFDFSYLDVLTSRTPPRSYITAFVITAVLDLFITALMLWFLIRAKSQAVSRRLDKIIGRLLTMLWEAAFPPCACAIVACTVYITSSMENLWDIFWQSILGKLYVISLFVILNGRADLKDAPPDVTDMNASAGLSRYYLTAADLRVDLTTVVTDLDRTDDGMTPMSEQFGSERLCIPNSNSREKNREFSYASSVRHVESTIGSVAPDPGGGRYVRQHSDASSGLMQTSP